MKKANGYWNKETCYQEALKYKTKKELEKSCGSAYNVARKNGWLDDYTWMVDGNILGALKRTKWTKETCYQEALKYSTRSEFAKNSRAYQVAWKKGWLDDYTWFVDGRAKLFVDKIDSVYKYVFSDGAIYIGRTLMNRQKERHKEHKTDAVGKYAKEHNVEMPQMIIIEDNLTLKEGLEREDYWVNWYKENGYNVINKQKTGIGCGSLGAINTGKWTKEAVFEEAKKYQSRTEFQKNSSTAYQVAWKKGWLDDYTWFKELCKPNGYWQNKENVFAEALKYQSRTEFQKKCIGAYVVARKKGWLSEMDWFENKQKPSGYWNVFENVEKEAKKYPTRSEFCKGNGSAYIVARKHKWMDILFPAKKAA